MEGKKNKEGASSNISIGQKVKKKIKTWNPREEKKKHMRSRFGPKYMRYHIFEKFG